MTSVFKRNVSPIRVAELLKTRDVYQVAAILRISRDEVSEIAEAAGKPRAPVIIRNARTGETARAMGWRSAYRLAQQLGFADWDWWEEAKGGSG